LIFNFRIIKRPLQYKITIYTGGELYFITNVFFIYLSRVLVITV